VPQRPAPGRAVATRRAVTDIVRTAVLGCYGVVGFATPSPWGHLIRGLGLGEPGIQLVLDDLRVDLRIRVAYGLPIAEVARQVESSVRYAVSRDLGREPTEVTIHVVGLVQREGTVPVATESPTVAGAEATVDPEAAAAAPGPTAAVAPAPTAGGTAREPIDEAHEPARVPHLEADPAEPGGGR
jgi:uncharacterized alkaline shock family protein YloU